MTCGLGLAQLGELGGHVRHRAVVLAELPAGGDRRSRWQRSPRRSAPRRAPPPGRAGRRRPRAIAARQRSSSAGDLGGGERRDRRRAAVLGDPAQRGGGEVVVGVRRSASRPASVSTNDLGRPAPAARAALRALARPRPGRRRASRRGAGGSPAGLSPSRAPSSAAVAAPRSSSSCGDPVAGAPVRRRARRQRPARPLPPSSTSFFTTPTLRNSAEHLQTGAPVIHDTGASPGAPTIEDQICRRTMTRRVALPAARSAAALRRWRSPRWSPTSASSSPAGRSGSPAPASAARPGRGAPTTRTRRPPRWASTA